MIRVPAAAMAARAGAGAAVTLTAPVAVAPSAPAAAAAAANTAAAPAPAASASGSKDNDGAALADAAAFKQELLAALPGRAAAVLSDPESVKYNHIHLVLNTTLPAGDPVLATPVPRKPTAESLAASAQSAAATVQSLRGALASLGHGLPTKHEALAGFFRFAPAPAPIPVPVDAAAAAAPAAVAPESPAPAARATVSVGVGGAAAAAAAAEQAEAAEVEIAPGSVVVGPDGREIDVAALRDGDTLPAGTIIRAPAAPRRRRRLLGLPAIGLAKLLHKAPKVVPVESTDYVQVTEYRDKVVTRQEVVMRPKTTMEDVVVQVNDDDDDGVLLFFLLCVLVCCVECARGFRTMHADSNWPHAPTATISINPLQPLQ